MKLLKDKILSEGRALSKEVLKVDSFLNHAVDPELMYEMGKCFKEYFSNKGITKVFTIESSGIAPAVMTALQMNAPTASFERFKSFINEDDKILIIDDFLANGEAAQGAARLIEEAGAEVAGIGIVIEKSFQPGRGILEDKNYDIYSLARVKRLDEGIIEFL